MAKIPDIPTISEGEVELLEAVGYLDTGDFAGVDSQDLYEELVKANEKLEILDEDPSLEQVQEWLAFHRGKKSAAEKTSTDEDVDSSSELPVIKGERVNYENDPDMMEKLAGSPIAQPLSGALIKKHAIAVKDIAEGILLTDCESDLDIKVRKNPNLSGTKSADNGSSSKSFDSSEIRSFEEMGDGIEPLDRGPARETLTASEEANEGRKSSSRGFVRGILHPSAMRLKLAAFFTVVFFIILPISIIGITLAFIYQYVNEVEMFWWVLGMLVVTVISGLLYLTVGLSGRCCVCSQKQFAPKYCQKHVKAHRFPLLGYILPTALHLLWYKWSHCIYCGTSIRVKK